MSAIRKIVVSVATLLLGLSATFVATGTAAADPSDRTVQIECENDWHTPCP
jgi:phosphate-selective porin